VIQIETRDGRTAFHPGEEVEGTVRWSPVDRPPRSLEVRLFWYTEGKGGRDVGVVETLPLADPGPEGHQPFRFRLPDGPYSFSGKIIHLLWAIEAVAEPDDHSERLAERLDIIMSPSGREIVLATEPAGAGKR
jgi:hypothetical protein